MEIHRVPPRFERDRLGLPLRMREVGQPKENREQAGQRGQTLPGPLLQTAQRTALFQTLFVV